MRYAIADFQEKDGQIIDTDLIWREGTQEEAETVVLKDHTKCVLFYFGDVKRGCPLDENATRDIFEADPARYGICFYHCWAGYRYE